DQFPGVAELFQVERILQKFGMAQDVPPDPYIWLRAIRALRRDGSRPWPTIDQLVPLEPDEVDMMIELIDLDDA
ncbi:hypothetical protein KI387_025072, partial [Taxus chinensis]